jgi:hypothetical protein
MKRNIPSIEHHQAALLAALALLSTAMWPSSSHAADTLRPEIPPGCYGVNFIVRARSWMGLPVAVNASVMTINANRQVCTPPSGGGCDGAKPLGSTTVTVPLTDSDSSIYSTYNGCFFMPAVAYNTSDAQGGFYATVTVPNSNYGTWYSGVDHWIVNKPIVEPVVFEILTPPQ